MAYPVKESKNREREIRSSLWRIRNQIKGGDESELAVWVIPQKLACSQRPLRDHPTFGGYTPLPPKAKPLVIAWVERMKEIGFKSVICLLEDRQLDRYYVRGGLGLHQRGLLGYIESQGLEVRHFPTTDYQRPSDELTEAAYKAWRQLPKPVLVFCSAAIDRSTPVAAGIAKRESGGLEKLW